MRADVQRFDSASSLTSSQRAVIEVKQPGLLDRYPRAYSAWSAAEDEHLRRLTEQGATATQLSDLHGRHPGSIRSRLKHLGVGGSVEPKRVGRGQRPVPSMSSE
jgi:hypothetical protein